MNSENSGHYKSGRRKNGVCIRLYWKRVLLGRYMCRMRAYAYTCYEGTLLGWFIGVDNVCIPSIL